MKELGQRLEKFRRRKQLSVSDCARYLGVSVSTYREWENGRAIKGEPYRLLAELFEVSLSEIICGEISEMDRALQKLDLQLVELRSYVKSLRVFL